MRAWKWWPQKWPLRSPRTHSKTNKHACLCRRFLNHQQAFHITLTRAHALLACTHYYHTWVNTVCMLLFIYIYINITTCLFFVEAMPCILEVDDHTTNIISQFQASQPPTNLKCIGFHVGFVVFFGVFGFFNFLFCIKSNKNLNPTQYF